MSEIQTILFPVDLSEASPILARKIRGIAEKLEARLLVLFVVRNMEHYGIMGVPYTYTQDFEDQIYKKAEASLAEFLETHFAGMKAEAHIGRGYPSEEILRFAQENKVDMIALGTHGRKGLEKILFGSVAEHVVKHATVPVLTINPFRAETA